MSPEPWHYPPLPIGASRAVTYPPGRGGGRPGGWSRMKTREASRATQGARRAWMSRGRRPGFPADGGLEWAVNGGRRRRGLRMLAKLLMRRGCLELGRQSEPLGQYVEVLGMGWAGEMRCLPAGAGWKRINSIRSMKSSTYRSNVRPACCKPHSASSAAIILLGPFICHGLCGRKDAGDLRWVKTSLI